MWNRKRRRIEELEEKLRAAIEDQVTVTVPMPPNLPATIVGVDKGVWHHVAYRYMIDQNFPEPGSTVRMSDMVVEREPSLGDYFDGTTAPYGYDWKGAPDAEG